MEETSPRTIRWGKQRVDPLFKGLLYDLTTCPVAGSAASWSLMEARGGRAQPEQRRKRRPHAAGKPCPIRLWHRLCFSIWSKLRARGVGVWKWFPIHILLNSNASPLPQLDGEDALSRSRTCTGRTRCGQWRCIFHPVCQRFENIIFDTISWHNSRFILVSVISRHHWENISYNALIL